MSLDDSALREERAALLEMVVRGEPPEQIHAAAATLLRDGLGGGRIAVAFAEGESLRLAHALDIPEKTRLPLSRRPLDTEHNPGAETVARGEAIIVADLEAEPRWRSYRGTLRHCGARSEWCYPIITGDGKVIGTVSVLRDEPGPPREAEANLIRDTADLLATSVERQRLFSSLARDALHDPLTGLGNRRLVDERLRQALSTARTRGTAVGVALLDLNRFKPINDEYGHETGDRVLQAVATRLRDSVRPSDTVGRLGGDEFVVLLNNVTTEQCESIAEDLNETIARPVDLGDAIFNVGASIGIAVSEGESDAAGLLRAADEAMYRAKEAGQHDPQIAGPGGRRGPARQSRGDVTVEVDVRVRANAERRPTGLRLVIVGLRNDGSMVSLDELVRERRAADRMEEFESNVVLTLRERIAPITEAIGPTDLILDVTASQADDPGFLDRLAESASSNGLALERLELVLTPEAGEMMPAEWVEWAAELRERLPGARIALNCFGTGGAGIDLAIALRPDALLLPSSLLRPVKGLPSPGLLKALVDAAGQVADRVVATGIGTREELDLLAEAGATEFEGPLFDRQHRRH